VTGNLDAVRLEQSIQTIIARHELLRATFALQNDEPMQIIAPVLRVPLSQVDLTALPELERPVVAEQTALAAAAEPFDLQHGPLLRAQLITLRADEAWLVVVFHHIISDGWSVGNFCRELGALYDAQWNGTPPALPALPIQYADYARWQQKWLQSEAYQQQLAYWKQQLAGAPSLLALPTDKPRPKQQRYRGQQMSTLLPKDLTDALRTFSQQQGATLFMTLLAAWQTLLARYSGQDQIVVGTPIAGRTQVETEPLIGFFVNTLALRGDLAGDPTFLELLHRTRERCLQAYAHQKLPFEKLVEELQPDRSLSYAPIFQVMFALQNAPVAATQWGGLKLEPIKLPSQTAKFDLSLDVIEEAEGLRAWWEYDTELFEAATMAQMQEYFCLLLETIVQYPHARLSEFPCPKINPAAARAALPRLRAALPTPTQYAAPRTATEEIIAEIWAAALRRTQISRHDDFFELGGHSLLAAKVIARLRDAFAVPLPLRLLFEASTIAALATAIDQQLAAQTSNEELEALLAELEALSDDEAEALVAAGQGANH
jgi:acyl carrier protein